ncbi:hypothetical protein F5887DRAFT_1076952 [Amanita rubescens]|nr:hypothetical protein F5887DRAFT_1078114 [Amanita rubescens]KAF8340830.1 hypothetical protein F5887DRAFT_1076952 [Amanita rubescens]
MLTPARFRSSIPSRIPLLLSFHITRALQAPTSNESRPRIFALKTSNAELELPQSEEQEALEKTYLALTKYASDARDALDNERNVDWVIMGGSKTHTTGEDRWTARRGQRDGQALARAGGIDRST